MIAILLSAAVASIFTFLAHEIQNPQILADDDPQGFCGWDAHIVRLAR